MAKKPLGGFGMLGAYTPSGTTRPGIGLGVASSPGQALVDQFRTGQGIGPRRARSGSNTNKRKKTR